jgi:hypothetical protein
LTKDLGKSEKYNIGKKVWKLVSIQGIKGVAVSADYFRFDIIISKHIN